MDRICKKNCCGQTAVREAFTLVEILVVVVILGIAMVMAVPMFSSAASVQVDSAANMIASDLEYARSMAITKQQSYGAQFYVDTDKYRIIDHNSNVVEHPINRGNFEIIFPSQRNLNQVDISGIDIDGSDKVSFDYLGSPFNNTGTAMNNEGVITISAGGITKTVRISPVTGYVRIE